MKERQPKPGTKRAIVRGLLEEGASHDEIMTETGFSSREVARAKSGIYKQGYAERPGEEERRRDWKESHPGHVLTRDESRRISELLKGREISDKTRENISRAKGGTWLTIRKYAKMGMFVREIATATLSEMREEVSSTKIQSALKKARKRGDISNLSKKEIGEGRRVSHEPWEKTRQRVQSWLSLERLFLEQDVEERPSLREDWLLLINYYQARKEMVMGGGNGAMTAFSRKLDDETLERLRPYINVIRDETVSSDPSRTRVGENALIVHGEITPAEALH